MLFAQKLKSLPTNLINCQCPNIKALKLKKGIKLFFLGLTFYFLPIFRIAAQTPIPLQPVQPSLWWAVERFGQNLVEDLRLDPVNQTVEIEINEGVWSTWDYLKRYALIEQLGRVASDHLIDNLINLITKLH
jgi:hypothetical protein